MTKSRNINHARMRWTPDAEQLLRDCYPDTATATLAERFGCSAHQIYRKAYDMDLKKSAAYLASEQACRLRRGGSVGAASRFAPGGEPWNKGLKGSTGTHPNSRATQFKPGRRAEQAHNYKPIGSHRINADGALERKVSDDPSLAPARRWVGVHRLVWQEANGPIPAGHLVHFKRGMATNELDQITLEKLECVSRQEHMRTHTYHQYGPEVAGLVTLRGALTRQINKREKGQK